MTAQTSGNFTDTNSLGNVTVLGVSGQVSNVTLNGQSISSGWFWDSSTNVLSLTGLNNFTSNGTWNSDWELTWSVNGVSGNSSSGSGSGSGSAGSSSGAGYLTAPVLVGLMAGLAGVLGLL